jgi:hypothetical protein
VGEVPAPGEVRSGASAERYQVFVHVGTGTLRRRRMAPPRTPTSPAPRSTPASAFPRKLHADSPAMRAWQRYPEARRAISSTSAAAPAPSRPHSGERCTSGTAAVAFPAARPASARRITSGTGRMGARPTSPTPSSSAGTITACCTKEAGRCPSPVEGTPSFGIPWGWRPPTTVGPRSLRCQRGGGPRPTRTWMARMGQAAPRHRLPI